MSFRRCVSAVTFGMASSATLALGVCTFRRLCALIFLVSIYLMNSSRLDAQAGDNQPSVMTLHVYENLVQIPVLVLSNGFQSIDPVGSNRFSISLDSGPPFRAKHVRPEGDDPISLSILIDVNGGQDDLLKKIGQVFAEFGRTSLQGRDRLSIYVED